MDRGRGRYRGRGADIGGAADGDVVAGDVHRVSREALACRGNRRMVGRERRTGVAVQDALKPLDGIGGVGLQRAAQQFVVEPALEDCALRRIEGSAEMLIVLDLRDQGLAGLGTAVRDLRQGAR